MGGVVAALSGSGLFSSISDMPGISGF